MEYLISTIFRKEDIVKIKNAGANAFVFGVNGFSTKIKFKVNKDEIKEILDIANELNMNAFISLNILVHDELIEALRDLLNYIKDYNFSGIYGTDLAMFSLLEEVNLLDKLIYNPDTTITNYYDAYHWYQKGIECITVSKEITLDDMIKIGNYFEGNKEVIVHGKLNMFSSKRMLIENFFKYLEEDYSKLVDNYDLYLIEEIRTGKMPILQDDFGTHIFSEYTLNSFNEIIKLRENGYNYFRIDGIFKDIDYVCEITNIYKNILDGKEYDFNELIESLNKKFNDNLESGFYYKKTTYIK